MEIDDHGRGSAAKAADHTDADGTGKAMASLEPVVAVEANRRAV